MNSLKVVVLFLCLACAWPVAQQGTTGKVSGNFKVNLQTDAAFDFTYSGPGPIVACFVEVAELPSPELFSPDTCNIFWTSETSEPPSAHFALRAVKYNYGVFLPSQPTNGSLYVRGSGATCPDNWIFDEQQCRGVDATIDTDTQSQLSVMMTEQPIYLAINIPFNDIFLVSHLSVSIDSPLGTTVESYLRFMGSPSEDFSDYQVAPFNITSPAHGTWFLVMELDEGEPTNVTVVVNKTVCPRDRTGTNCSTYISVMNSESFVEGYTLAAGEYHYFRWSSTLPLWVSVRSTSDSLQVPKVLVRYNQTPDDTHHQAYNCNEGNCATTHSIRFIKPDPSAIWFIAVTPQDGNETQFTIYFDSYCFKNCTNTTHHGVCEEGEKRGLCKCRYGWKGMACDIVTPFDNAFSVLIIFGSVILLAATSGLIYSTISKPDTPEYKSVPFW